jgi:hypothetical protein
MWNGKWMMLVFLDATNADPHFRYLRSLLVQEQSLVLSRGVYLAAGTFSGRIMQVCESLYPTAVAIFSVDTWHRGVDRPLIVNYYDLTAKAEILSGISDNLVELLDRINQNKESTNQQKTAVSSIIDRFVESLRENPGFMSHYFPDVPGVMDIISKIQQVINL